MTTTKMTKAQLAATLNATRNALDKSAENAHGYLTELASARRQVEDLEFTMGGKERELASAKAEAAAAASKVAEYQALDLVGITYSRCVAALMPLMRASYLAGRSDPIEDNTAVHLVLVFLAQRFGIPVERIEEHAV